MSAITAGLSSAFPVLSIVVLNQVDSINQKLGILTVFAVLFSTLLALLSPNKKLEIFTASATLVLRPSHKHTCANEIQVCGSQRGFHSILINSAARSIQSGRLRSAPEVTLANLNSATTNVTITSSTITFVGVGK